MFKGLKINSNSDDKRPKYKRLADAIEKWIRKNKLKAGTKLPSDRELVKYFGVTTVTIGRSLGELLAIGLIERKVGVGTFVKAQKKEYRIGVFSHEPLLEPTISHILSNLHLFWYENRGILMYIICDAKDYRLKIAENKLDGVIVVSPLPKCIPEVLSLKQEGFPVITLGVYFDKLGEISFGHDHVESGKKAVHYLIERGYKKIGLALPRNYNIGSKLRLEGYRLAMWEANLPIHPNWEIPMGKWDDPKYVAMMTSHLTGKDRPEALIICMAGLIMPLYNLLHQLKLRIPEDIGLIAFDNLDYVTYLSSPLTVFTEDTDKCCQIAAQKLLNLITHTDKKEDISNCNELFLIKRSSCL